MAFPTTVATSEFTAKLIKSPSSSNPSVVFNEIKNLDNTYRVFGIVKFKATSNDIGALIKRDVKHYIAIAKGENYYEYELVQ